MNAKGFVGAIVASAVLVGASPVEAEDLPIAGRVLKVNTSGEDPKHLFVFKSETGRVPAAFWNPDSTAEGGASLLFRWRTATGEGRTELIRLPAEYWQGLGNPAGTKGWRYKDKSSSHGGVKSILVKLDDRGSSVRVKARGDGWAWDLPGDVQEGFVHLRLGEGEYCASFGPDRGLIRPRTDGDLYVTRMPAPAACASDVCGDGRVEGSEQCDDGNLDDLDSCTNACTQNDVAPTPEPTAQPTPEPTAQPTPEPTPEPGPEDWDLVWADEFEGPAGAPPDGSKWNTEVGGWGWGNQELQYYTDAPANASLDGAGHLRLTAREETVAGSSCWYGDCLYSSARLSTENLFDQRYGRIEARIRVPFGQGLWPAFWMLGNDFRDVGWPACGEIDIMENVGREPSTVHGTVHGPGYSGGGGLSGSFSLADGARFSDDFHVFAIEWQAGEIRWLVDGQITHVLRPDSVPGGAPWVFDHPFFLILNVAVGGLWPGSPDATTNFPQQMTVDYVRVYEKKEIIPEPFTYVVLPDTQFMTMGHNQSQAEMFYRQTEWVVEKADELNIKFVSHLGDIVEFGGAREQWEVADQALSALDGKVPYGLTFGNHDADDQVWGRSDGLFNEYFPAWRYEGESWYGGGYPAGKNTNSYQLFRSGDAEYLVLHLQWDPPTDVRAWAGGILAAHPDRRAIVSTHEFPGNWVLWNEVLKHQANVFLIVSGHECARERLLTLENDFGGRVYSILTDYQCDNPAKAFLRYYEFRADGSVDAVTYSPWTDEYEIDDSSSFTFVPDHGTGIACENASQPWGGTAHPIPGRIEAEQYDEGCEGVAYHDLDGVNEGGAYRTDGVDLEPTNDGGVNLGWTRDGEWLNYNVEVAEEGRYDLRIRVASEGDGSVFRLDFDDAPLTGPIAVAPTGGWQIWTEGTVADLAMSAGTHVLTVHIEDGDFNLDWMEWTLASPAPTATPAPTASPGPTATPAPTATPLPTASPAPTGTPSPGPTPDPGSAEILYFQANRLHLIGQASTTTAGTLSRAPGTGGRFDRLPVGPTPLVYEITNLTVPYDPALQDTRLSLYLEGTSTAGVIAQARVRYDFEGDGTFDREETFTAGVAHATQGLHRYDSETFPLAASVGDYRDLDGGTVRLELWNPLVPVREGPDVRTGSAPAEHSPSHIVIPFAFPPTEIVAGETPRRRVDYPEGVLCPTDAPDPRCGPGFSDETALEEAALEQAITQGLAAFRFDGAHGSCAGCHVADAFDLAVIGYSDADIRRRALEHVSSEQAEQIVQLVHAQRQRHGLDRVLHPGHFRPLQPGFEPLPGDTVRERDFAFLQHLADEQNLILMNDVIDSREKALLAEQQLLALDVHSLRIGVRLDRWSEDSFHGPSHVGQAPYAEAQGQDGSVAEWLPNMATVPLANRAQEFYALFDAYAANPTDLAFWRFYDSIAEITESHEPLLNDDDSWAYEWMRTKYESIQVMGHMLRHQTLDFPDLAIDQPEPEGLDALAASILRNPLWRVGDMIRQRPLDCPTPELCTTFPPFVPNETDPAKLNVQSRVLQRAWFWAGWMVDRALLRSDESFATISGDYFYPLHHGFWNGHYAFITAKMSVEKANEASMSESWDNARAGHGKWASIRPFLVYKHSEFQRPLPGPTDPAYELNRRLMTNLARMWIYLVHADLERTGQAFDRAGTAKAVNFARLNWLDSVDPGGPREDIEARFTEIVDMLRTAEELRQPHHRFDLYEYLPVADVDVGPAP